MKWGVRFRPGAVFFVERNKANAHYPNPVQVVYHQKRVMRAQAIFAVMLVFFTSVAGACPACDRAHLEDSAAQSANMPANAHACCERLKPSESRTDKVPESNSLPPTQRCSHETASLMLEAASPDHAVVLDMAAAALPSFVALVELVPEANAQEWRIAVSPSPPPLLALPIRI